MDLCEEKKKRCKENVCKCTWQNVNFSKNVYQIWDANEDMKEFWSVDELVEIISLLFNMVEIHFADWYFCVYSISHWFASVIDWIRRRNADYISARETCKGGGKMQFLILPPYGNLRNSFLLFFPQHSTRSGSTSVWCLITFDQSSVSPFLLCNPWESRNSTRYQWKTRA